MNDLVLELQGVTRIYNAGKENEVAVLRGVDLRLAQGEMVALVAPSGAGKSTLLHSAGLLDRPDAGSVRICGVATEKSPDAIRTGLRRSSIGFVYQFHHLLPEFSALENVMLPQLANGTPEKAAKERAGALLQRVGLGARLSHRPSQLSGGEQQRVAFCRALANEPALLLADEPTGNLDQGTAEQVFDTMLSLCRDSGLSAVVATHNPELAARMDRTLHLNAGHLEAL